MCSSDDEQDYYDTFMQHFPIFFYIKFNRVSTDTEMSFDTSTSDVALVCKYFDAENNHQLDQIYKGIQ